MKEKNTSDRLNEILAENGWKQADMLKRLIPYFEAFNQKITKSHLSQWVSGKNEPNQMKTVIIAQALNVSEPWLMGFDVPRNDNDNKGNEILDKYSDYIPMIEKMEKLSDSDKYMIESLINSLYEKSAK